MPCNRCGCRLTHSVICPQDPDFCKKCFRHIEGLMPRAQAAVALLNSRGVQDKGLEVGAFLSIFHPELSEQKMREIVADVRENNR